MSYANVNVRIGIVAFFLCLAEKKNCFEELEGFDE